MHFGASKEIFSKAKELRQNMTLAENKLWSYLNNNQLGYRFRRQHPIGRYIADFYCHKKKLIMELDGGIHYFYLKIQNMIMDDLLIYMNLKLQLLDLEMNK